MTLLWLSAPVTALMLMVIVIIPSGISRQALGKLGKQRRVRCFTRGEEVLVDRGAGSVSCWAS